jgi:hypothetical protein
MNQEEIERYKTDYAIIRETAAQVIKDFNMAGFNITFSGNELLAFNELKDQIKPVLSALYHDQPGQFRNLLYRIDLDERQLSALLSACDTSRIADVLAERILQREFEKVLTRRFFSR